MKKTVLILGLAAPSSWVLVPLMAIPASRGTDGGWSGMHTMFQAMAFVLIIHVICVLGLLTVFGLRLKARQSAGKGLGFALLYFAIILGVFMMGSGPQEVWRDASALIRGLFGKT